jgi:hypothetical protein
VNGSEELERAESWQEAGPSSRRASPLTQLPVVLVLAGKVLAGALAALAIVTAWGVWAPPTDARDRELLEGGLVATVSGFKAATETEVAGWSDKRDYGVLYPLLSGDDAKSMANLPPSPSNKMWSALTGDLYPILDKAGAIFIDATQYRVGIPPPPIRNLPVQSIYVNLNYLARYPILGEDQRPIAVDPAETAWVVAVPAQYKSYQAQMEAWLGKLRHGGDGFEGAFQYAERSGYPVPERFRTQKVRIIWTEPEQKVFSFDSRVNPSGGNTILDPIVEIMTPANSLRVDRLNGVGAPDGALKVFTGGDPAGTYARLLPTLQRLELDDNLKQIVFANEAPLLRIDQAAAESRISRATAVTIALVMLALGAASAVMIVARLRRVLIVRRLHGFSAARRNRELITAGALSALGMLLIGGLALLADRTGGYAPPSWRGIADGDLTGIALRLAVVILALSAAELMLALAIAGIIQRRTGALLVKQL